MTLLGIRFDPHDQLSESDARELMLAVEDAGASVEIAERSDLRGFMGAESVVTLMLASSMSAAVISGVLAYLYRVFRKGVLVDLTGSRPLISSASELPRGSALVLYADGRQELIEAATAEHLVELVKAVAKS